MISIIIPTFNRDAFLLNAIKAITLLDFSSEEYEILIIDNGSSDNTREVSEKIIEDNAHNNIKYFFEPSPGLLAARHKGALEAQGDILTFIDDDIIPFPTWLSAIRDAFEDEKIQLVGGKSLPKFEEAPPPWLAGLWGTTQYGGVSCGYLSLLDIGDKPTQIHPNYIWGLNLSIRKKAFNEAGGFHPDLYPKYLQRFQGDGETGLTMRCYNLGFKAYYIPDAGVYHCIPPQRLTVQYFENRMFYQGVCDSYSHIKNNSETNQEKLSLYKSISKSSMDLTIRIKSCLINSLINNKTSESDFLKRVKDRMKKAYREGYLFHQTEVKKDPNLLKWILKDNYWDYHIPIDKNVAISENKYEKSY